MRVKEGKEQLLLDMDNMSAAIPGHIQTYVYKADNEPNVYYLATVFESREAYRKNAESPEQHQRYLQMMEALDGEPEWHDGDIVATQSGS
jgi:heme-degrading monooxygenase HmoA